MTEQDKQVSHREMRNALYFRHSLISSLAADDQECAAALRTVADIDDLAVLQRTVGSDGVWAARRALEDYAAAH